MKNGDAKVRFRGDQLKRAWRRFNAGFHLAMIGIPGSGKTMLAKMILLMWDGQNPENMTHDEMDDAFKLQILEEKIFYVQGTESLEPIDVIGGFVKANNTYCNKCSWSTIVYEGERWVTCPECESDDLGQDNLGLVWRDGPLAKAAKRGAPFFWNEMSRCPQGTQDVVMSLLSEGVMSIPGLGETIIANDGFIMVADMNTEEHDAKVHAFCWALGSRLRKIEFDNPDDDTVRKILEDRLSTQGLVDPLVRLYNEVDVLHKESEVQRPILVRGLLEHAKDFDLEVKEGETPREAFIVGADSTWRADVLGSRQRGAELVDSTVRKIADSLVIADTGDFKMRDVAELEKLHRLFKDVLGVPRLGFNSVRNLASENALTTWANAWALLDPSINFWGSKGVGWNKRSQIKAGLYLTTTNPTQSPGWRDDLTHETVENQKKFLQYVPGRLLGFALGANGVAVEYQNLNADHNVETFSDLNDLWNAEAMKIETDYPRVATWITSNPDLLGELVGHDVML